MQNITILKTSTLVCGGTTVPSSPTPITNSGLGGSSAACGGNDALMTSLNSIGSSIKDLSNNNNNDGLFGGDGSAMLMFGMAIAMRNRNEGSSNTVVVNGGGGVAVAVAVAASPLHARW